MLPGQTVSSRRCLALRRELTFNDAVDVENVQSISAGRSRTNRTLALGVPHRSSSPGQVGQAHLGIFPREDHPVRAGLERGGCRGIGVVARSLAAVLASGDTD